MLRFSDVVMNPRINKWDAHLFLEGASKSRQRRGNTFLEELEKGNLEQECE